MLASVLLTTYSRGNFSGRCAQYLVQNLAKFVARPRLFRQKIFGAAVITLGNSMTFCRNSQSLVRIMAGRQKHCGSI